MNEYSKKADKYLELIGNCGEALSAISKANNPEEITKALSSIVTGLTDESFKSFSYDKHSAASIILRNLEFIEKQYAFQLHASRDYETVQEDILKYLESYTFGENIKRLNKHYRKEVQEAWVIIPARKCKWGDLIEITEMICEEFKIKPETPSEKDRLGTLFNFNLKGVNFSIGLEPDYDFNPNGSELSLQLSF